MLLDILQCDVPFASNAVLCASDSSIIHLPSAAYYSTLQLPFGREIAFILPLLQVHYLV